MYYIYILKRGKNEEYYIGYTEDLKKRFKQHKAKYPCKLIYYEAYLLEKQAKEREKKLKLYGSAWRGLKKRLLPD